MIDLLIFILEPSATSTSSSDSIIESMAANQELAALVQRLEAVAVRLEKNTSGGEVVGKFKKIIISGEIMHLPQERNIPHHK